MSLPLPSIAIDLKDISTKFPSPNVGKVRTSITKCEGEESQKTPGLWMLVIEQQLEEPWTTFDNKPLAPGFKFFSRITLPGGPAQDTEKMTAKEQQELRARQLCMFLDAALKTDKDTRPSNLNEVLETGVLIGKQLITEFKKSRDDTYGDTEVKGYKATQD